MHIQFAYICLILLWSTTPLAIKWSSLGSGFLFGAGLRMAIGLVGVGMLVLGLRLRLVWHRQAVLTYLAVASQLYGAMVIVYWAAQFVPSGWVSVVFGLVPLLTAVIGALFLGQRSLSLGNLFAYGFGLGGLYLMFGSALQISVSSVWAIAALVVAAFSQAASAVWVKQLNAGLPVLIQMLGGLLLAVPAYALSWWLWDGHWPQQIPQQTWMAIAYLGLLATTFGFSLYYYVLKHLTALRVAMISLLSPVLALMLGHWLNNEPLTLPILQGAGLIMCALLQHELTDYSVRHKIKTTKFV